MKVRHFISLARRSPSQQSALVKSQTALFQYHFRGKSDSENANLTLEKIKTISKTYYKMLSKAQMDDMRAFTLSPCDISSFPSGALVFLYKVLASHPLPNGGEVVNKIFSIFRERISADPKTSNMPTLSRYHAICLVRFHTAALRRMREQKQRFIELPEDLFGSLHNLAFPKGSTDGASLRGRHPREAVKQTLAKIQQHTAELTLLHKHESKTDPTLKIIRTMSALASDVYELKSDPASQTAIALSNDRGCIEEAGRVLCTVIEKRFPTQIGKIHNFETIGALSALRKSAENSNAMRLYKEYFLGTTAKTYDTESVNDLIFILFHTFSAVRVLLTFRSPDAFEIAHAAFKCCLRNEAVLRAEQWAQVTILRMVHISNSLRSKDIPPIMMKILCFPSILELIGNECDTALAVSLVEFLNSQVFVSQGDRLLREALMERLQKALRTSSEKTKECPEAAPEALCAIVNMAMRGDTSESHRDTWKAVHSRLERENEEYFTALSQQSLTCLVTFLCASTAIEGTASLWAKLTKVIIDRQRSDHLSLQNASFMYDVVTRSLQPEKSAFRWALLVAIIIRLRVFILKDEWEPFAAEVRNIPFIQSAINRSALMRLALAVSKVIGSAKQVSTRELQMTALCLRFARRAVHRTLKPHMNTNEEPIIFFEMKEREVTVFEAFGEDDERTRSLYLESLRVFDNLALKTVPTTKDFCSYVIGYGHVLRAQHAVAKPVQSCAVDRLFLQLAFERIWQDKEILKYKASGNRRDGVREALQRMGKHWAPQIWEYIESIKR